MAWVSAGAFPSLNEKNSQNCRIAAFHPYWGVDNVPVWIQPDEARPGAVGIMSMRTYSHWINADSVPVRFRDIGESPYRLRPGSRARHSLFQRSIDSLAETAGAALRLAIPTMLLFTLLATTYLYSDALLPLDHVPNVVRNSGFVVGDLVFPLAWLTIHLTNRCYGPDYAFAQLCGAVLIGTGILFFNHAYIDAWLGSMPAFTTRAATSYVVAFLFSNVLGIILFDSSRGPKWWSAPLTSSIAIALTFSAIYYPAAFAGTHVAWLGSAALHLGGFCVEAVFLLLPYYLLRAAMPPLHGLNGY